jgi:hypothetical protein
LAHSENFKSAKIYVLCYFDQVKPTLQSKFFPAKIFFSKIQKKNLAGKIYFAKERGPFEHSRPETCIG